MKSIWVTLIIVITWIAAAFFILTTKISIFPAIVVTLLVTFYLILFGLQKQTD
ncbi:MAG: hypothetical protein WC080_02050 [Patescibacteria group bacterium]|jgi:hypothetical protein